MPFRKEVVQQVQQVQTPTTVSTSSNNPFPSNLVVVKTASGKNIVLKVISQTTEVSTIYKGCRKLKTQSSGDFGVHNEGIFFSEMVTDRFSCRHVSNKSFQQFMFRSFGFPGPPKVI